MLKTATLPAAISKLCLNSYSTAKQNNSTMKLSILAFTLAGTASVLAQQGGFLDSCDSSTIKVEGRYLTATCNSITGGNKRCSKLDLNRCLKNQFGQLVPDSL